MGLDIITSEMPLRSPSGEVNRQSAVLREKTELEIKPDELFVSLVQGEGGRCGSALRIKPTKLRRNSLERGKAREVGSWQPTRGRVQEGRGGQGLSAGRTTG